MRVKKGLNETCPKIICEICGCNEKKILHRHHIVEKTDINCNNNPFNLLVSCPTCHSKIHAEIIKIIGIFPSTNPIMKRTVIYVNETGQCNVPGMENEKSYYTPKNSEMKIYNIKEEENEETKSIA